MKKLNWKSSLSISVVVVGISMLISGFAAAPQGPAGQGSLNSGLIHWWKFNGNGMDSAGELDCSPQGPYDYVPAVMGYGISLDGSATGISLPPMHDLQFQSSFTISAWALLRSYPADGKLWSSIIFCGDDRSGYDPYALQVNPSGKMAFLTTGEKNNLEEIQTPFPLNKYVLVTGTYDKELGIQSLYIDGHLVGKKEGQGDLTPVVDLVEKEKPGVGIGTNNAFPKSRYNFGWNGVINDLRIYERALSGGEVQALYKLGLENVRSNGLLK